MRLTRRAASAAAAALLLTGGIAVVETAVTAAPASAAVVHCSSSSHDAQLFNSFNDWSYSYYNNPSWCIAFRGTWDIPSNSTYVFCAGNNNGSVYFYDKTTNTDYGKNYSYDHSYDIQGVGGWGPPTYQGDDLIIDAVIINNWTGSASCER